MPAQISASPTASRREILYSFLISVILLSVLPVSVRGPLDGAGQFLLQDVPGPAVGRLGGHGDVVVADADHFPFVVLAVPDNQHLAGVLEVVRNQTPNKLTARVGYVHIDVGHLRDI